MTAEATFDYPGPRSARRSVRVPPHCSVGLVKPTEVSCEEFVRQEIQYFERQAAKTRGAASPHLRAMHLSYLGLARNRRAQLERLR